MIQLYDVGDKCSKNEVVDDLRYLIENDANPGC